MRLYDLLIQHWIMDITYNKKSKSWKITPSKSIINIYYTMNQATKKKKKKKLKKIKKKLIKKKKKWIDCMDFFFYLFYIQ